MRGKARQGEEERRTVLERNFSKRNAAKKASCPLQARCSGKNFYTASPNFRDVLGRRPPIAFLNVKAYPITLTQALETGHVNGSMMDKHIAAFILLDETKSLLVIKPFHNSFCHRPASFLLGCFKCSQNTGHLMAKDASLTRHSTS